RGRAGARSGDLAATARRDRLPRTGRGVAVDGAARDLDVAVGDDVSRAADDGAGTLRVDDAVRHGEVAARGKGVGDEGRSDRKGVVRPRRARERGGGNGGQHDDGDPIIHLIFPFGLVLRSLPPGISPRSTLAASPLPLMARSSMRSPGAAEIVAWKL